MSTQIDTVKRVLVLFNALPGDQEARRTHPALAELFALFEPDIEFVPPPNQPDRSMWSSAGIDQLARGWEEWFDAWDEQRSYPEDFAEAGNRVLARTNDRFRGRDGIEIELKGATIYTFRGPRIARIQAFFDWDTARREFGAL